MAKDKKHGHGYHDDNSDQIAKSLLANGKEQEREHTRRMNRMWMWIGVIILIIILLFFIFMTGFWGLADLWNNY